MQQRGNATAATAGGRATADTRGRPHALVDAFLLASQGKSLQGSVALMRLTRLMDGLPEQPAGDTGLAWWSVQGETAQGGLAKTGLMSGQSLLHLPLLHLHVRANPVLVCQRCNALFAYPVDSRVTLQLVRSEVELDDDLPGDSQEDFQDPLPEKVLGSHRFNLLAQVEDELILSIPYVPKHDVCPGAQAKPGEASQEPAVRRPSPFAALEQLKRKP